MEAAESRGARPLYLPNTSQLLFFFSILFKLKLSKVLPDKSEGCRGSGLSFLLLTTSAKDNTVGSGGGGVAAGGGGQSGNTRAPTRA